MDHDDSTLPHLVLTVTGPWSSQRDQRPVSRACTRLLVGFVTLARDCELRLSLYLTLRTSPFRQTLPWAHVDVPEQVPDLHRPHSSAGSAAGTTAIPSTRRSTSGPVVTTQRVQQVLTRRSASQPKRLTSASPTTSASLTSIATTRWSWTHDDAVDLPLARLGPQVVDPCLSRLGEHPHAERDQRLEQGAQQCPVTGNGRTHPRSVEKRLLVHPSRRAARARSARWCLGPPASLMRWFSVGSQAERGRGSTAARAVSRYGRSWSWQASRGGVVPLSHAASSISLSSKIYY
jgi:hypothetical protein